MSGHSAAVSAIREARDYAAQVLVCIEEDGHPVGRWGWAMAYREEMARSLVHAVIGLVEWMSEADDSCRGGE